MPLSVPNATNHNSFTDMSKFVTTLNVDIDALLKNAPRGTFIHSATLSDDRKTVAVVWDNPRFVSHSCEGKEFSIEQLKSGELPDQVTLADWAKKPQTVKVESAPTEAQPESVGVGNKEVESAPVKLKK
jgi:hypothetical protein